MTVQRFNTVRQSVLPRLHPMDGLIGTRLVPPRGEARALIRERGDEYVLSVQCDYQDLVDALAAYDYRNNWLSTLKYVDAADGRSWERGSMAYRPDGWTGRWMHHAYWMPAAEADWTYHIGHHKERNYFDLPDGPSEHTQRTDDLFEPFDPDGHLEAAVSKADLEYTPLDTPRYAPE